MHIRQWNCIWTIKEWAGRRIGTLPFNYTFWHYTMPSLMQKYGKNIDRNTQKQGYEFLSHKN